MNNTNILKDKTTNNSDGIYYLHTYKINPFRTILRFLNTKLYEVICLKEMYLCYDIILIKN